tara:strand:+ start:850 stop:4581 length:3732 start_codon:yes stop_codon:yes gene_type:complete
MYGVQSKPPVGLILAFFGCCVFLIVAGYIYEKYKPCEINEHVSGGKCTACPSGETRAAGDSPSDGDTTCEGSLLDGSSHCQVNQYAINGSCIDCVTGHKNRTADPITSTTSSCDVCDVGWHVSNGVCTQCTNNTTTLGGDLISGGVDTECTLCMDNYKWTLTGGNGSCTPCPTGSTSSGLPASGDVESNCTSSGSSGSSSSSSGNPYCEAGKYSLNNGQSCGTCEAGKTSIRHLKTTPMSAFTCFTPCEGDQYASNNSCYPCSGGRASSQGSFNPTGISGTEEEQCTRCKANHYVDHTNPSTPCLPCPNGKINTHTDARLSDGTSQTFLYKDETTGVERTDIGIDNCKTFCEDTQYIKCSRTTPSNPWECECENCPEDGSFRYNHADKPLEDYITEPWIGEEECVLSCATNPSSSTPNLWNDGDNQCTSYCNSAAFTSTIEAAFNHMVTCIQQEPAQDSGTPPSSPCEEEDIRSRITTLDDLKQRCSGEPAAVSTINDIIDSYKTLLRSRPCPPDYKYNPDPTDAYERCEICGDSEDEACTAPTCTFTAGDAASCTNTAGCTYIAPVAAVDESCVDSSGDECTFTAGDEASCTNTADCTYIAPVAAVPEACTVPTCPFTPGDEASCTNTLGCSYTPAVVSSDGWSGADDLVAHTSIRSNVANPRTECRRLQCADTEKLVVADDGGDGSEFDGSQLSGGVCVSCPRVRGEPICMGDYSETGRLCKLNDEGNGCVEDTGNCVFREDGSKSNMVGQPVDSDGVRTEHTISPSDATYADNTFCLSPTPAKCSSIVDTGLTLDAACGPEASGITDQDPGQVDCLSDPCLLNTDGLIPGHHDHSKCCTIHETCGTGAVLDTGTFRNISGTDFSLQTFRDDAGEPYINKIITIKQPQSLGGGEIGIGIITGYNNPGGINQITSIDWINETPPTFEAFEACSNAACPTYVIYDPEGVGLAEHGGPQGTVFGCPEGTILNEEEIEGTCSGQDCNRSTGADKLLCCKDNEYGYIISPNDTCIWTNKNEDQVTGLEYIVGETGLPGVSPTDDGKNKCKAAFDAILERRGGGESSLLEPIPDLTPRYDNDLPFMGAGALAEDSEAPPGCWWWASSANDNAGHKNKVWYNQGGFDTTHVSTGAYPSRKAICKGLIADIESAEATMPPVNEVCAWTACNSGGADPCCSGLGLRCGSAGNCSVSGTRYHNKTGSSPEAAYGGTACSGNMGSCTITEYCSSSHCRVGSSSSHTPGGMGR